MTVNALRKAVYAFHKQLLRIYFAQQCASHWKYTDERSRS